MTETNPVNYQQEVPDILNSLAAVHPVMDGHGLDRRLQHLLRLRASQINRCAFCVKMHTREAREDGETSDRLDRVIVWDQVHDFSASEKAALAWTEALTLLVPGTDLGPLRSRLREHFSDKDIGALTSEIAMINLWNRIQISGH